MEFYIASAGTVAFLGIAFFIIFRQKINELIDRIRTIGKSGVSVDPAQKEATTERDPRAEAEALIRELDSTLIREVEEHITNEFQQRRLSGDEAFRVVKRYLAVTYIALSFEVTYRLIWGSQLNLLDYLNSQIDGQPTEALRPFYVLASSQYPEWYGGYSFEQWLGFLRDQLLIREDAARIRITVRGREFLTHLTRMGYMRNKAG